MYMYSVSACECRGQKATLDSLDLELQAVNRELTWVWKSNSASPLQEKHILSV